MLIVILIYDLVLFRPLVAWADRFRFEHEPGIPPPRSWVLNVLRRSGIVALLIRPVAKIWRHSLGRPSSPTAKSAPRSRERSRWAGDRLWSAIVLLAAAAALWRVSRFVMQGLTPADIGEAFALGLATLLRIVVLIAIASMVWVPIGVWIGTHPRATRVVQPIAQLLAAFPANLLFPIVVSAIVVYRLNPDIWLSPLMILGTQWYIVFNVIAGAAAIPSELRDCCVNLQVRGWLWWRTAALPAVFPYYVTGAVTAAGGSWNASIVAEVASWGDRHLAAYGLGAYIAIATHDGDFHRIVLGIAVMSLFVVVINRALWRPLYQQAERKFRLG
jgi:NitT/TauT family transport system permease protein